VPSGFLISSTQWPWTLMPSDLPSGSGFSASAAGFFAFGLASFSSGGFWSCPACRIGRNGLKAMEVCRGYAEAQLDISFPDRSSLENWPLERRSATEASLPKASTSGCALKKLPMTVNGTLFRRHH
jgi:hypothetical protein